METDDTQCSTKIYRQRIQRHMVKGICMYVKLIYMQ
jgi:hypothetical protein